MRSAVCLSGQMRTYRICYENLCRYILEPYSPDVFIHTWKNTGVTHHIEDLIPRSSFNRQYIVEDNEVTYEGLDKLYSPKLCVIEEFVEGYTEELDGRRVPKILKEKESKHYKGSLPMFYKMKKCNELKQEWENRRDFIYDIVIRLRPDLMIKERIPKEVCEDSNTLWYSDYAINKSLQVSDKFAISSSKVMDYYTSVWDFINNYWKNPLGDGTWETYRVGERLMKFHIDRGPFAAKPFSIECYIEREKPIPKGFISKVSELLMGIIKS